MHKLSFLEFKKIIISLNPLKRENLHLKRVNELQFLEVLALCLHDCSLKPELKAKIMSEKNYSIKISKSYINNPDLFLKEEGKSIRSQIKDFFLRDIIRLIDLAYLTIFFNSDFYTELIQKLDFVEAKQHQILQDFEEIYYKALYLENILLCRNPYELYKKLGEKKMYNLEIHMHIFNILKGPEKDLKEIKSCKNLLKVLEENSILFTMNESNLEIFKEKIFKLELIIQTKLLSQKYSLNKSLLQIENLPSNLIIIVSEFKKEFNGTKDIEKRIEIMKDFTVFIPFVQFSESTITERLKIYDFLFSLLNSNCKKIGHITELIKYSCEIIEIFFQEDKNVFVDNLKLKIQDLKCLVKVDEQLALSNYDLLMNSKLLIIKNSNFYLNCEPNFINILNNHSENQAKIQKIKTLIKSLNIFVSITEKIVDFEFEMFEKELDSIFKIIQKLVNLKVKYLIDAKLENNLKIEIHDLQFKIINFQLLIMKFKNDKFINQKETIKKIPNLCKDHRIAKYYLHSVQKSLDILILIKDKSEIGKILEIIPKIFFCKSLFIDTASIIIDELVDAYNICKKVFSQLVCNKNLYTLKINEILKLYKKERKYRKILKRNLPKYIKINSTFKKTEIIQILQKYYESYSNDIIKNPLDDYKKLIYISKISKYIYKKNLKIFFPEISPISEIKIQFDLWKSKLTSKNFDIISFKDFCNEAILNIKKLRLNLKLDQQMSKNNYIYKSTECKKLLSEIRCILYQFSKSKNIKKIDFLINNLFVYKKNLQVLRELAGYKNFTGRNLIIFEIIRNYDELSLSNQLKSLKLEVEIKTKFNFLEREISNLSYINDKEEADTCYENRHKFYVKIENVNLGLHDLSADLNAIDVLSKNKEICKILRNEIDALISKNNLVFSLLNDICKFTNVEAYNLLMNETQKPLKVISLEKIIEINFTHKEKIEKQINNLKYKIPELYFVSCDDILNFINGNLCIEDILKNIYNIDGLILEKEICIGIKSKNEKVYFINQIEQSHKYKSPDDFKVFYEKFKNEFQNTLREYLILKFKSIREEAIDFIKEDTILKSKNKQIDFLDEFFNEYKYFNSFKYQETTKIKFLKKHEQELGKDFRFLYPKPVIKIENDNLILKTDSLQLYSYELTYFPPSKLIYTKLTNTIFNKITLSLNTSSGVILYGESSTGKTETVKYYCRSIGKPLYIFCCNENLNIDLLKNIITGCLKNNWFLCLDECNRLDSSVMSKMSDLLVGINGRIKVFLTLNLGYLGRNNLPTTLKYLFIEIRVDNPDLEDILDIYFDKKIKYLLRHLKEKSHNLSHYNFSLRAINTILYNSNIKNGSGDESLTRNMLTYYYSIFNEKDKLILKDHISNLSKEDLFLYGIYRSTGILLFGDSQCGKSTLLKNMIDKTNVKYKILHKYDEDILYKLVKENTNDELWIIYDFILESTWIENLNSILDENKILCLKNGEIIKIGKNIRFIFETNDISRITPATLTRVFTIYFEKNNNYTSSNVYHDDKVIDFNTESVIFLQGEMGIGKRTLFLEKTKGRNALFLNCREIKSFLPYECKLIYLEEYEKANENLVGEIKEFYEFNTIKDEKKDFQLFLSYNGKNDLQDYNYTRRINCKILNITKVENKEIDKDMCEYYKNRNIRYDECYKFNLGLEKDYLKKILQEDSEFCLKEMIEFFISNKFNFILLGNRVSGKHWLLKEYSLDIKEVFEETCFITYNNKTTTAILTDDLDLLSKRIIKENFIIRLRNIKQIVLDFKEFINNIDTLSINHQTNILKYDFIKNLKFKKCECCIDEEIDLKDVTDFENIININTENMKLSFPNIFKLSDFIYTSVMIYRKFSNNSKFILDGLEKIQNFHKISQDKKISLHKHNLSLFKYQEDLKIKIVDIQTIETEINQEKIMIENKKNQQSMLYKEIQKKKDFINFKLQEGEIKLKESVLKVKKINKKNIAEIRSMNKPPKAVHFVINLIYNIVNNNNRVVPWSELLVFLRSSDVFLVLECINFDIKLDINSLKEKEKEIMKSSQVCFLFYEWIINNYDYKMIKEEIKPLENEISNLSLEEESIVKHLHDEGEKVKLLNYKLQKYRKDYLNYSTTLKNTKDEIKLLNEEIVKYESLLDKLKEERDNWKICKFNLKIVMENFYENKILLSNTNTNYLSTSTKDINFKKVVSNIYKYKNNIFISNVSKNPEIYKLCKFQTNEKDFNIIISQHNTNFYSCIGYKFNVIKKFIYNDDINIKNLEDKLLNVILKGNIDEILECKKMLDLARIKLTKIIDIKNYYDKLNRVYKILYDKYNLSFEVYKEFIYKNDKTLLFKSIVSNNIKFNNTGSEELLKDEDILPNIDNLKNLSFDKFKVEESLLLKDGINYCTNLSLDEIYKYDTNILIITNTDDYIYYLEKNIQFKEVISIGDKNHNKTYKNLLQDKNNNIYLVKNIDLYNEVIEDKSNNKFIYISEYNKSRTILKDCRVIYMKYKFNYERSLEFYKKLYNDPGIIELHCKMIKKLYDNKLERKYMYTVKDLELLIKNKELVSLEYLKYLVYTNKIDINNKD